MLSSSWLGSYPNLSGSRNRDLSAHLIWGTQSSKVSQSTSNALKTRQDKVASCIAWPLPKRKYLLPWLQKLIYLEPQVQGILSVESSSPSLSISWKTMLGLGLSSFPHFEVVSLCRKKCWLHWDRDQTSFNCTPTSLETWEPEGDAILLVLVLVSYAQP